MNPPRTSCLAWLLFVASELFLTSFVSAQEVALRSGESVDLGSVYWAEGCTSTLITLVGVDVLEGPPGVKLSLRKEDVQPRQQNCPTKIQGGVVVASVKDVPTPTAGVLKYRVRYKTTNGSRQSEHSVQMSLQP